MDAAILKQRLAAEALTICRELLPGGKIKGHEWCAGGLDGREGDSLKVVISGPKVGIWAEYGALDWGDIDKGDLLDLWAAVKRLTIGEALQEVRDRYGIPKPITKQATKKKDFKRPEKPKAKQFAGSEAETWLKTERGIYPSTCRAWKLATADEYKGVSKKDGRAFSIPGPWILFPYLRPDAQGKMSLINLKWLHRDRDKDGKKRTAQAERAEYCLWGWHMRPKASRKAIVVEGECFPGDAEVLTPTGWVRLDRYRDEMVLQVEEGGAGRFVSPVAKVEKPYVGMLKRHEGRDWVSETTPEHNLVSIDFTGRWRKRPANNPPAAWRIPRTAKADGPGIPLSDDQLRLCIAVSADAAIRPLLNTGNHKAPEDRYAVFAFKKARKIKRMRQLIDALGLQTSDHEIASGYTSICFHLPGWVPGRLLPWAWIGGASLHQRQLMLDELVHWDGNRVPNRNQTEFATKERHNAEWAQTLAHTAGICSSIIPRENHIGHWLKVSLLHGKSTSSWQSARSSEVEFDGIVHCVTVPSGMLLVRQGGQIMVSGNCDALTVWQCLWDLQRNQDYAVFSVPAGAGTGEKHDWIENDWERLEEFEEFILDFDEDTDGEAATADVARRLGLHRCRRTRKPHKDANECLVQHAMTPASIIALYDNAEAMAPETLKGAKEFVDEVIERFYPTKATALGIALPWPKASSLRLRLGEVSTVTGPSSAGKSALLNQVCLYAMDSGYKSLIASMEMPGADTLARASRQACRAYPPEREEIIRFHDWLDGRLWIFNVKGSTTPGVLIPDMVYARRRFGVTLFVIDSLMRCGIAMDEYEKQDQFMKDLCAFAESEMVHVMLVAHGRKRQDPRRPMSKEDIKGSLGITDNAFNNIIVARNTAKELKMAAIEETAGDDRDTKLADLVVKPDATLTVDKQRNDLGWIGTVPLWYDKRTCLYRDNRDEDPPMLLTFRSANSNTPEIPDDLETLWQESDRALV